MFVTRHQGITDARLRDQLWSLYAVATHGADRTAAVRLTVDHLDFDAQVSDPLHRLWVVWDDTTPVAAALIATDPRARTPAGRALSTAWFEQAYPDHALRGAVHQLCWVVTHPAWVARGALIRLAKDAFAAEAAEGALLVFDAPQALQPDDTGGMAALVHEAARLVAPDATVTRIEVERTFVTDFGQVADAPGGSVRPADRLDSLP
ncbi:MAG: hypothetical protein U0Q03_16350 [Acidimicrobiales bacterium]